MLVINVSKAKNVIGLRDLIAFMLIVAIFSLLKHSVKEMYLPIEEIVSHPISLDWRELPEYSVQTVIRMLIAVVFSLVFSIVYATLAAKSTRLEKILIPMLDILQSVPILGYLSFTTAAFMALSPGKIVGVDLAAIFAIFTSQAWNMTFSFYQSLKTIPQDLKDVSTLMRLTPTHRFFYLELPFALPGLIWNTMLSMSGGWFFVVAAEAISVGDIQYNLPGIGSYIALAITNKDLTAVMYAVGSMAIVILIYDQVMFRPLVAWADKFRFEDIRNGVPPKSWVLDFFRNTKIVYICSRPSMAIVNFLIKVSYDKNAASKKKNTIFSPQFKERAEDLIWYFTIAAFATYGLTKIVFFLENNTELKEISNVIILSFLTMFRVVVLIIISCLFWVPVGVYIGLRPRLTGYVQAILQFLAAFPVNLIFPIAVIGILKFDLNPSIWLSPLLILGTQWYILFNVIAGVSVFPSDLKEVANNFDIKGWIWWKKVMLPGIFPYIITGAITASGGAWNASIVGEIVSWGDTQLIAPGIGSYIAIATTNGDFDKIVLGISALSIFVLVFNKLVWRPLYKFAEDRVKF